MATTASVTPSGNLQLDGLLSGVRWAGDALTYSFPQSGSLYGTGYGSGENTNGFEAFTSLQQAAIRDILGSFSEVTNLHFVEVIETSSVHGDLRYAESDAVSTAWAYYPNTSAIGGDAWFNNSKNWYDNPAPGNYAWLTMMHETGHALGLKHPHEAKGSFGSLPIEFDSLEYTVMSYRSYVGASTTSGYTNGSTSYPQTLMMLDIAALQKMYGANFSTNAGDTVYAWSPTTGEMSINGVGQGAPAGNKIFMTIWDGGGNDSYDFSAYAGGVSVNLNPGGWTTTSATQLANLGNGKLAVGNIANALLYEGNLASLIENVIGGSGNDTIIGNVVDNVITGGKGNDTIDGGAGIDTAVYSGQLSQYTLVDNGDGSWSLIDLMSGRDGTDLLRGIELLKFSDGMVALAEAVDPDAPPPAEPVDLNDAPVAISDSYVVTKNSKLTVSAANGVLANDIDADGDTLSAILVQGPSSGSLSLKSDGSFIYTPAKNFTGTVSFTYKTSDGEANSAATTVSLVVGATTATKGGKGGGITQPHEDDDHQIPAPSTGDTDMWLPRQMIEDMRPGSPGLDVLASLPQQGGLPRGPVDGLALFDPFEMPFGIQQPGAFLSGDYLVG